MTSESSSQFSQDMSSKASETSTAESVSPIASPVAATKAEALKRHRDESCDAEETSAMPPAKSAKMAYSIMNILAIDKKEPKPNVANKENSLESESVSPAPAIIDNQAQSINPFFLNPFMAAAAAAASHSGQSNLLSNISNLAMLSKSQSTEMWPWFNMAAMSAIYGLDKGYTPGLFASIDNSHLRHLSAGAQSNIGHVTSKNDVHALAESAYQRANKSGMPNEQANRSVSQSSSSSMSPLSGKYGPDEMNKKSEARKLFNRSLDDDDGNRLGFSGASMGDDGDLDDDNEVIEDEEDDSNNGDSFDNMRKKKTRTVFSRNQVFQLESTFDMKRYLSSSERSSLANSLQLTETQIKIWFQNRRNKWKRQLAAEIETSHSNQHQQTQHQLSVSSSASLGNQRGSLGSNNQRVVRVPVLYQSESQRSAIGQEIDHVQSSSSSTHSSMASPSNSSLKSAQTHVNPASLLSPSMLAAAAAASSLYYAAAAHAQPGQFQNFNLNVAAGSNNAGKQSISSIL